ncbi:MAG TPA: site-specific integrase [Anaerolineae bacterium]|nr:site-specific integrase [Anaerolineae bacterium]
MSGEQLSLFDAPDEHSPEPAKIEGGVDRSRANALTSRTRLAVAMDAYREHMIARRFAENTVKAFMYDLNIVAEFFTPNKPVGEIAHRDLEKFIDWLVTGRGVPCNPKSLARRITTLKTFFGWLKESGTILIDPAAPIVHQPVKTPLPDTLFDNEIDAVLAVTQQLRAGALSVSDSPSKPDVRPHLLVTLLLATGIKKSECVAIKLEHIDLSDPTEPALWIRYADARHRHKERKLRLDRKWPDLLEAYKSQYAIQDMLFPWSARNLEYVLADVGRLAGLNKPLSFETLRWTCAVRDKRGGMPDETLRRKLGLSTITWREAGEKLAKLTAPAL